MNDIIKHKDYYATVHFSTEDEVFYGKISGVNDLVTFEGSSVKELKSGFKEAVEDYIITCREAGKEHEKNNFNLVCSNSRKHAKHQ